MQTINTKIHGKEEDYLLGELLGQGQFGKVFRGRNQPNSSDVAIKVIRRNKFIRKQKLKLLIERQIKILSNLNHPNVIKFHQIISNKNDVYLVYQYCDGGTLQDKITLREQQLIPIFEQILQALVYAEKIGVIHRDIKPANILFKQGKIKVADWGFSRLLTNGETTCSFIGSPAYMAPQVLKNEEYSLKADVWSLGIVLYQSLTGNCPWMSNNISSLYSQVVKKPLYFPAQIKISSNFKNIIKQMLTISSDQRPSCSMLKKKMHLFTRKQSSTLYKIQQSNQQKKIMSCVFFLQMIQWGRKQLTTSKKFMFFAKLIEQNLLKLKPVCQNQREIAVIWQKQFKVVRQIKQKLQLKCLNKKSSSKILSRNQSAKTSESEDNPQSEWQSLVKQTIKYVIQQLETCYKQMNNKSKTLIDLNLLLDLIIFSEMPEQYLKASVDSYLQQLSDYNKKTLLKLLNYKLLLINKRYYH